MKSYGVTRLKIEVYVEIKHVQKYKSSENKLWQFPDVAKVLIRKVGDFIKRRSPVRGELFLLLPKLLTTTNCLAGKLVKF